MTLPGQNYVICNSDPRLHDSRLQFVPSETFSLAPCCQPLVVAAHRRDLYRFNFGLTVGSLVNPGSELM